MARWYTVEFVLFLGPEFITDLLTEPDLYVVDSLFDIQKMSGCLPGDFEMRWYLIILKVYCRKLPDAAAELAEMCNQDRRCGHQKCPAYFGHVDLGGG